MSESDVINEILKHHLFILEELNVNTKKKP